MQRRSIEALRKFRARVFLGLVPLSLSVLATAPALLGQTAAYTGTITGIVTDTQGAIVSNADVTATAIATNVPTSTKSNQSGVYSIPNLPVGTYSVEVKAPSFKSFVKVGVLIDPNGIVQVDAPLAVGSSTQTVNVTTQAPLLETQQATLDTTISHTFVEDLPNEVNGGIRDITTLLSLVGGVSQGANSFQTNITGGRPFGQELLLDGVPMVYTSLASVALTSEPDQEVISEVQVQTGVPTAQWGHSTGGVGSFITRSGTSQYHGGAVLLLRNTVLDATPYNSLTKTRDQQFELPMTIGGPIWLPKIYEHKDRSFFFFNYSMYRTASNEAPLITTVPTTLERGGNFSDLPASVILYDPTTGQPFPAIASESGCSVGRCIPTSRFSALSSAYLSFIPSPTNSLLTNNYIGRTPASDKEDHYFAKVDHKIGNNNTLIGTFRWDNLDSFLAANPFGSTLGGRHDLTAYRMLTIADVSVLKSNIVNSLSANYSRWFDVVTGTPPNIFSTQIPGSYGHSFPYVSFSTLYASGYSVGANTAFFNTDPFWNFQEQLSWTVGKHSLQFGGRYSSYISQTGSDVNTENGGYNFSPLETGLGSTTAGNPFASYLLGEVDSASMNVPQDLGFSTRYWAFYAQDGYRSGPKVTLNFGLRWDIQKPFNSPGSSLMDPSTPNPGAGNIPGAIIYTGPNGTGSQFMPTWFGAIAPRFGVAWNVEPRTVVRVGFGIMYGPAEYLLSRVSFPGANAVSPSPGVPVFQWDQGWPARLVPNPLAPPSSTVSNGQGGVVTLDFRNGKSNRLADEDILQFDVQHSFKDVLVDAAYVGQFTHHITGSNGSDEILQANINQLPVSDMKYGTLLTDQINDPAVLAAGFAPPYPGFQGTLAQALRSFPQYQGINDEIPLGNSSYNALIVSAQKRFSHDLAFVASYTLSKTLTNVSLADSALPAPQDQYNPAAQRSVANTDIPQVLALSYVYHLPLGPGEAFINNGFISKALEGFSVAGIQSYQSGYPITISAPTNDLPIFNGVLQFNRGAGPFTTGGRGHIELGNSLYGTTGTTYLNSAAFALPPPVLIPDPANPAQQIANPAVVANPYLALGNLKYVLPNVRNLGTYSESLSFFKSQTFHDRYTLRVGADFLNAFNRKNYAGLNTTYGSAGFGTYSANATPPRSVQINARISF